MNSLVDQAREVLRSTERATADHPIAGMVSDAFRRLDEPLRVAVAGRVKAGKSTLVNAMVGEQVAATDARECTRIVTWYRDGVTYRVEGVDLGGERSPLRFDRDHGALEIDLGHRVPEQLSCIEVTWPSARLREMTLVDTPGIDSLTDAASQRTERFLTGVDRPTPTDAVLYLLRHVHSGDIRFLEAFHDEELSAANPVNSIGVLSRADEIGAARVDALRSADRIAARWRADQRLGRLVQTVVPVAGLLAEAASTLRQVEFASLSTLANADPGLVDELLVSVDRFASSSAQVGVVDIERRALLDRLGIFGCRLAIDLIRSGDSPSATALAEGLLAASGLPDLRTEIRDRLSRRQDLLKARHALAVARMAALELNDRKLASDVERIVDGAHEFAELRVLNLLRSSGIEFPGDRATAARRLLGDNGMSVAARAGVDSGAGAADVKAALADQLAMWQQQAEHPLATPAASAAARTLSRTCEGLLIAMSE